MKFFDDINNYIDFSVKWVLIGLMVVIPGVMMFQVIIRYVFNYPTTWAEELVRICFVWVVFMSACAALRRGEVVALDFIIRRLNRHLAFFLTQLGRVFVLVFLSFAIYSGYDMTSFVFMRKAPTPAMGFPLWVVYLAIPLGCFFMFYQLLLNLIHDLLTKKNLPPTEDPVTERD